MYGCVVMDEKTTKGSNNFTDLLQSSSDTALSEVISKIIGKSKTMALLITCRSF